MSTVSTMRVVADIDGEGSPIVFVHGLGGTSNSFQTLLGALSGFRCVRPDLPGSGRSRLPHQPLSIASMVEAVADAMKSFGAAPAHLAGHSMGTIVCQHIASQMPELAKSMTLFGPILEPGDAARQRIRERAQAARSHGMGAVADAVTNAGLSSSSKAHNPLSIAFVRESHMRQEAEGFAQTCEALASATAADLRLIRCPTLIVTGSEDAVAPPAVAQAIAEKIKGAKSKVLDMCGHWTPIEKPQDCAKLLSDFVRSLRD